MADDILFGEPILLAEIDAKFYGFFVNARKIRGISQTALTDFKAYMGIVRCASGMPSSMIPRQRLVGGDASISQLADEAVNTDLPAIRLVLIPMIVVLVLPQKSVIRTDITFQIGVVRPVECTMMPLGVMVLPALKQALFVKMSLCRFILLTLSIKLCKDRF